MPTLISNIWVEFLLNFIYIIIMFRDIFSKISFLSAVILCTVKIQKRHYKLLLRWNCCIVHHCIASILPSARQCEINVWQRIWWCVNSMKDSESIYWFFYTPRRTMMHGWALFPKSLFRQYYHIIMFILYKHLLNKQVKIFLTIQ